MKVPVSWLREFADVPADPAAVSARMASCGFAVEDVTGDVIDFEITANRPDCLSVYGLAREAAAAFDVDLKAPELVPTPDGAAAVKVSIGDPGCARYALFVADVTVGPSPEWLAARLTAAGVRPINNVVDITNYVMLELGHPMHAFDVAKLGGPEIHVRRARAGEKLKTLDGHDRTLDETMLVIADKDKAVAIAGVMGGADSEVSAGTTRIAVESAWFQPASVRATSKKVGLKTEASIRFERGADLGRARAGARPRARAAAENRRGACRRSRERRVPAPGACPHGRPRPRASRAPARRHGAGRRRRAHPHEARLRAHRRPAGLVGGRAVLSRRRRCGKPTSSRMSAAIGDSTGFPRRSPRCARRPARRFLGWRGRGRCGGCSAAPDSRKPSRSRSSRTPGRRRSRPKATGSR